MSEAEQTDPETERWTKAGAVEEPADSEQLDRLALRTEASIAEPAALGLLSFGIGTIEIAIVLGGFVPQADIAAAAPSLLATAGFTQILAGIIAFVKGNTFGGTAFGIFGANNVMVASFILLQTVGVYAAGPDSNLLLGVELACMTYISVILAIAAMKMYRVFVATLCTITIGFALSAVHDFGKSVIIGHIGGYFFIISSICAFYGAGAVVINAAWRRNVLPMGKF